MNALSLLIIKSSLGYVLVFILIILVAAIIGFVTSRLISKSFYTPVINRLEEEKDGLNTLIQGLKDDAVSLNSKIDKLNKKVDQLESEIAKRKK